MQVIWILAWNVPSMKIGVKIPAYEIARLIMLLHGDFQKFILISSLGDICWWMTVTVYYKYWWNEQQEFTLFVNIDELFHMYFLGTGFLILTDIG